MQMGMEIAEVHRHARNGSQLVIRHLFAPVIGQRLAHGLGDSLSSFVKAFSTCAAVAGLA